VTTVPSETSTDTLAEAPPAPPRSDLATSVRVALAAAFRLHQAGRFLEAEMLYRGILKHDPDQIDALHLLGLATHQQGRHDEAERHIARAIALKDDAALFHINLGHVEAARRRHEAALAAYARALALAPGHPEALKGSGAANLALGRAREAADLYMTVLASQPGDARAHAGVGNARLLESEIQEAILHYEQSLALKPEQMEVRLNLANALLRLGRFDEAAAQCREALALAPDDARAHNGLALVLQQQGALDVATTHFERALALDPRNAEVQRNFAHLLLRQGESEAAEALFKRALTTRPDDSEIEAGLAYALVQRGDFEAGRQHYERALALSPASAMALNSLGNVLLQLGEIEAAVVHYRHALALTPADPGTHVNLATALGRLGQLDAAAASFARALALRPDDPLTHWNDALLRLLAGDYKTGWEKYEWRWHAARTVPRHAQHPLWRGEKLAGRTILLHHEQGLGDTIQFCRYVPLVAQAGAQVLLEVPASLAQLMRSLAAPVTVIPRGTALPAFDLQAPLMSLPRAFRTELPRVPAAIPYLRAQPDRVAAWGHRLAPVQGLRVGLCWAGDPRPGWRLGNSDRRRSIALARLAPLGAVPGVALISLQKGEGAAQAAAPPPGMTLHDVTSHIDDFADTAALIMNLRLVITVDTSIAHLAGALGQPVWLLNRFDTCWRWLLGRDDSPWYPTLRQFRQASPGDWDDVIARMAQALRLWAVDQA
jgi:tetratricopeptide (TPR) repeat protein